MGYAVARNIWSIVKWMWVAIIFAFALNYAGSIAQTQTADLIKTFPTSALGWLFFGPYQRITFLTLGIFLVITLLSGLFTLIGEYRTGGIALKRYLREVVERNQALSPTGMAQSSGTLLSVSVPLDTVFIHLNAVSDRPLYEMPAEQQKLFEELQRRTDLSIDQQEETMQRMRAIWHSQVGRGLLEAGQRRQIAMENILAACDGAHPGAIILGAPGSGKSTSMRWLALHMARASLQPGYRRLLNRFLQLLARMRVLSAFFTPLSELPDSMAPQQIPVLLRISDYAKRLDVQSLTFEEFFRESFNKKQPMLADRLDEELQKGRCLLLFDGLDEVASDSLRRRVVDQIMTFLSNHTPNTPSARLYNRFIVTSRIVGYEAGSFAGYAHYTLLDLEDEQVEEFLSAWCPEVERYQMRAPQGMKPLTRQQEEQASRQADEQKARLLLAFKNSPSIKRLAVNPLMLTILALIQRSGKTLPHRRIELYQVVTRTLLDNWNQETGRRVFPVEELPLAEQLMSRLAYQLHNSDLLLTEPQVRQIAREAMQDFYKAPPRDEAITQFIKTLRTSSGLFVETGQGLFSFMHRTFQEYYASHSLYTKPADNLKDFVREHYKKPTWREPLLLLVANKSGQQSADEQRQAGELIGVIANAQNPYDSILQRNLLFAAACLVDCSAWSVPKALQQRIATGLFDLYGDTYGTGRYTTLQAEIEQTALFWLRGQPQESTQTHAWPPLLETWRAALCDPNNPMRQEGATHLLASLAPDLPGCPEQVLLALTPPLLQLADTLDMSYPPENIRANLPHPAARPASLKVADYAFVALRLLDAAGPAGWLHTQWLTWSKEQPHLLERLTQHSLEIGYLLTPAAFPTRDGDPNWDKYSNMANEWKNHAQRNPGDLQIQLLHASNVARYPHAYLFKQMLEQETGGQPWRATWDNYLQKEMARGRTSTYQSCLSLQLWLSQGDQQQQQAIAADIMKALSTQSQQAMIAISNIYLLGFRDFRDLRYLLDFRDFRDLLDLRYFRDLLDLRYLRYLLDFRDKEYIINILCNMLQQEGERLYLALLSLYSIVASSNEPPAPSIEQQVQASVQHLAQQSQKLTTEQRLLLKALQRKLKPPAAPTPAAISPEMQTKVDERAIALHALAQQSQTIKPERPQTIKSEVEEILAACIDTSAVSKDRRDDAGDARTVQQAAWNLLDTSISLEADAWPVVLHALDNAEAIVCAAGALLLQRDKLLPQAIREQAIAKIMGLLADEELSRRPLDPPGYKVWRLDDVLFETLRALTEGR
ncbi:MAG: hypothetical protein ABI456_04585 [Ktedonobacteraceae bacterium]